ncbi:hypothetical protein PR202_ga20101 [Eleusine coracana subsp. coracana]|uniref:Uncharacterized protein n=1 Tax=Eleusine coracana subsp. coracana TaxID=191504 RepID=A0AAV5CXV7_ELECO|nr:hypothetical protein PR202_ga20101 [Eleusine coracana subsp. coracana]
MSGLEVALASALLKTAGGKLGSLITSEFASITGVQKDLSEMQDIHGEITSWLSVFRDRTIESDPSLRWVIKLTDVAYDIHDLLDEVHLEAEKQKVDNYNAKKDIATFFRAKSKSFQFRCKVVRRIKAIKVTFAAIVQQRNNANAILNNLAAHGLPVGSTNVPSVELSLLGHVEESKIPRRNKKDDIVSMLLGSNGENCLIVSIVGLGGSGKTTLAKHICHDKKIKEHFKDTIFWVHVSQEFCMEKLIGKLFGAIFKKKTDLLTPQHMLDEISNILTCKEFLLVLDDAWHDDRYDWEQFMVYLKSGALGSKILLTTRDRKVAEVVNSRNIFELAFLSNGESWSLFLNSSRCVEKDLDNEFIQVGKEAVNKCGGVPLAIRILGGIENIDISLFDRVRALYVSGRGPSFDKPIKKNHYVRSVILRYNIDAFPLFILKLEYIGYLEIDGLNCSELPEAISGCWNLQSLHLINCKGLRNLTRLTRLGRFPVGRREEDARISELENIDMISGNMVITNLQYVKDTTDAEKACLKRKSNIHSLELNWSTSEIEELVSNLEHDLTVLNALEPPAKVKTLSIGGYRGLCLPYWMGGESDTSCLEGIIIAKLEASTTCGLTSLITLQLDGMPKLEELWTITIEIEEEELGAKFCFPSLSSLKIRKCPKLNVKPYFPPSLEFLRLEQSNEMVLSPSTFSLLLPPSVNGASSSSNNVHSTVPRLKELELNRMSGSASDWEFLQHLTGLESLKIWNCNDLTKLPECIRSLTSLRHLYFYECSNLSVFPESLGELCSLEDLVVWDAPKMASLPQSTENLTSLVSLYIVGWDNMEQLPEVIQHLATLQRLYLSRCHALTELPEWIEQLSALQKLQIIECSALQSLPQSIRQLTSLKKLEIIACSPRWS